MASQSQTKFDPNRLTFDQGLERIREAVSKVGFDAGGRVTTSRDKGMEDVRQALEVENVPAGFRKWQLPVYLEGASQLYVTVAEPGAKAGRHSHDEGDGIRFIAGGSIRYEDRELSPGDWMFIPKGQAYEFEVGPFGALMCYCYCCSCA
jgi:quercetin dioxygenase-like cupin family protein